MTITPIRLLHQNATREAFLAFRGYIFGLWFLAILIDPMARLASLPAGYYLPVGVLRLLPEPAHAMLLSGGGLNALKGLLLVTCALSIWPRAFRWAGPPAVLLLLVYQSLIRGFTHINHAQILLLLAAITLVLFEHLPRRAAPAARNPYAAPLLTIAAVITLSYALLGSWRIYDDISTLTGDTILNYVASRSLRTSYYDFNVGLQVIGWAPAALMLRIGFPVITLVEMTALLVLVSRRYRALFLAVMVPFHLLTFVLMEVSFIENLLLYVVLVDFSPLVERFRPFLPFRRGRGPALAPPVPG